MNINSNSLIMGGREDNKHRLISDSDTDEEEFKTFEVLKSKILKESSPVVKQQQLETQKRKLIGEIRKLVGKEKEINRPLNVVVIGPPGVGKSSFINSVAAALSWDRWREHSYTGWHGGEGLPITAFVKSFPKCCNRNDYKGIALPQLIDVAGFSLDDTPEWEELLRIVLFGRLPEGESLASAHTYCKEFGIQGLKSKYSTYEEKLKVDRLIFVGSYTEPVPTNLINLVIRAARPTESHEMVLPLFGVMTKADQAENLTAEKVKEREKDFVNALGLGGAKTRFLSCRNYCDDLDEKLGFRRDEKIHPQLDIPILRFMKQVCDPVLSVQNEEATYTNGEEFKPKTPQTEVKNTAEIMGGLRKWILLGVEVVLVALLFQFWFSSPIDPSNLRSLCLAYNDHPHNFPGQSMRKLCQETNDGTRVQSSLFIPLLLYIILRGLSIYALAKIPKIYIEQHNDGVKLRTK